MLIRLKDVLQRPPHDLKFILNDSPYLKIYSGSVLPLFELAL